MSERIDQELLEGDAVPPPGRSVARDAGLNLVARVFAMACSSVTALVVANALTKTEYGAYAIVVGINVVLVMGLDLGLTSSLARYAAQGRATTRLVVSVALARLGLIGGAALVLLGLGVADVGGEIQALLPMLALLIVAQSLIAFHFGALPSLRRIRLLLLVTALQPATELLLVLVARARGGGADAMLFATASSALAVSLLAWVVLLAPGRAAARDVPEAPAATRATLQMVAHYGRRIFLVSLLIAVFGQVDQFVIGAFHPLAEVAPYALTLKLQALVAAPAITVASIVAPRIAGAGIGALALYRQWLGFLAALGIGEVVVLSVLSSEAFGAIGAQYVDDHLLLVAMGPFLLLSTVAPLPSIALNQTGHATQRLRVAGIAVATNLALDLLLVPSLGAWGAVIATTIAYAYYFARHHRLLEHALAADAPTAAAASAASLRPLLLRAAIVAAGAGAVAAVARLALDAAGIDDAVAVLLIAGGIAGTLHAVWCVRLVRTPASSGHRR